ncbi:MAG: transcription-repair coupling factor [Actinomycetota bacterium]
MSELTGLVELWNRSDLLDRVLEEGDAGAPEVVRPFLLAGLSLRASPLLVVVPRGRDAEAMHEALRLYCEPGELDLLPAWEVLPGEAMSPTLETMGRRVRVAHDLTMGAPRIVVTSARGLLQKVKATVAPPMVLEQGSEHPLEQLEESLAGFGFDRTYLVERPGEFAVRGGILDVFPPGRLRPVRADFFGDEITALREFSISSQRSHDAIGSVEILPTRELVLDEETRARASRLLESNGLLSEVVTDLERLANGVAFAGMEAYLGLLEKRLSPVAELLPEGSTVVVCDPKLVRDRASEFIAQAEQWGSPESLSLFSDYSSALGPEQPLQLWAFGRGEEGVDLDVSGWDEHAGRLADLAAQLTRLRAEGATIVVAAGPAARRAREVLAEEDLGLRIGPAAPEAAVVSVAPIEKGFLLRDFTPPLAVVGAQDLFGRRRPAPAPEEAARPAALLLELAPGDHVVHELYGVGRYHGMVTRVVAGILRDYLLVEYAGDDRLYVPTEHLEAVSKYAGGESPRLNRLGTAEWEKAKSRARRAVADVATDLAVLYAKRMRAEGHTFSPDSPWQSELEDSFPYLETPDQARAIDEVKADMERLQPMDRVVCGDVGYGKTEIAVRAAFKAVQDSKQVAVLVPTTILAQQHTQTFRERFAGFPIEVAHLSRFLTPAEQDEVLEKVATGRVDVVIGTHRLLQPDVKFHELGLLVVDEEQRFGVMHKETIKKLRESVDVITMSATPIPRTMEMALTGVRDMSLVDTPPVNRRPVLTYVGPSDARMIVAAIRRELARDGQVFYVHNRVRSIKGAARKIAGMVPGARVEIAHGQMSEGELERVMLDVWDGKVDVLVCTTIIESGLDIPAMNTLIVERADLLGLAQLYQLRGRVGRAGERAYAYFFFPDEAVLTEEAHERLKTLSEFTELGSGFKIALRDLEIRGAGNLLGAEQSGHIAAVGFDLYSRMMAEAVAELTGREPEKRPEVRIDLPEDAFVPADYIARESLRMETYRQIERIRSHEGTSELEAELADRYGSPPPPVHNLLRAAELRAWAFERGIEEISVRDGVLKVRPVSAFEESRLVRLERLHPGGEYKEVSRTLLVPGPTRDLAASVLNMLRAILD